MSEISCSTVPGKKLKGVGDCTSHSFHLKGEYEVGRAFSRGERKWYFVRGERLLSRSGSSRPVGQLGG